MKKLFLLLGCIVLICFVFSACDEAEESKADISKAESDVSQAVSETESDVSDEVSAEVSVGEESETPAESSEDASVGEESKTPNESETPNESDTPDESEALDNTSTAPSKLEVTDIVLPPDIYDDAIQLFYSDDEYEYYFPAMIMYSLKVHYSDGSTQNAKDAIDEGNITLADLDRFEIKYYKYSKATREPAE